MDSLYKVIKQLSEEDFEEFYENLTSNKADKSALFLKTIRESDNPVEDFLEKQNISASAFYVLKSRLNQKVEAYLLTRVGDADLEVIHKVFYIYDLLFDSPREIALTTLKRLEKTMIERDNPMALIQVYSAMKMLHNHEEDNLTDYDKLYKQAVAYNLAADQSKETLMNFFRVYDRYYLGRKEKDFKELAKQIERLGNLNNLYDSQRLYIYMSVVHLFGRRFMELPPQILEILEDEGEQFEKCFAILEKNPKDLVFRHLNLVFDFLRCFYYSNKEGAEDQARIYFELLDYKIEELITGFQMGMDCSPILFLKLEKHIREDTISLLTLDNNEYLAQIEPDPYRLARYVNFYLYLAYSAFHAGEYDEASRILYRLRNDVNLRKHPHMDVELKIFLSLCYILQSEFDLANQLILSLQRQLKKAHFANYDHGRFFLKILTNRQGSSRSAKKRDQLLSHIEDFNRTNKGPHALLPHLHLTPEVFDNVGSK